MFFTIDTFIEREENVKCDIFLAYRALLNINKPLHNITSGSELMETSETKLVKNKYSCTVCILSLPPPSLPPSLPPLSPLSLLQGQVPLIVKALHKQLKDKSIKSRQVLLQLHLI